MPGHVTRTRALRVPPRGGSSVHRTALAACSTSPLFLLLLPLLLLSFATPAHGYKELSDAALRGLPSGGAADFDIETGRLLAPLLIPRVPGTPGSAAAQRHLAGFFERELHPGWQLTWQNTTARVPATAEGEGEGEEVPFANLVARRDPPWAAGGDVPRLTLAAHYDSLRLPEGFVGAVDSAAPCAMLLHVARAVDDALTRRWDRLVAEGDVELGLNDERGLQILFLDGEEAWVSWSDSDSLYGARALAEAWEAETHPAGSTYRTPLESIELFVLLDLLGAPDPHVPSYFAKTHWAYAKMAAVEQRLREQGLLQQPRSSRPFLPEIEDKPAARFRGYVLDDHVPFLVRGVPVLHVIPTPFPPVWHRMEDDGAHLDPAAVEDWAKIVTAFVAEWMELDESMVKRPAEEAKPPEDREKLEL